MDSYQRLLDFIADLKHKRIHYTLECNREEAIMVLIAVPSGRWEVEFFTDGHVETEVFVSNGVNGDDDSEAELERFWQENGD